MELQIFDDAIVMVFPEGKLSDTSRRQFSDRLMDFARGGDFKKIVVDLAKTTWFSSVDLGVLAFALRECKDRDITLALANVSKRVRDVFVVTKMDQIFSMYDSVDAALKGDSPEEG